MKRRTSFAPFTFVLLAGVAVAAMLAVAVPARADGEADGACTETKFDFPAVEKACKDGGRKAVKPLMKAAIKRARADGKDYKCNTCHEDQKSYKLKDGAVDKLRPYIGS
jgi:predicted RecA/RadA family phage recombinase